MKMRIIVAAMNISWAVTKIEPKKDQGWYHAGAQSDFCNVIWGIPQGSILGPLLFTIFVNDFPSFNLFSKPTMYGDNDTLTSSSENPYVKMS